MHCKNFIIFIANVSLVMAVCMQAESMLITKNQINCNKKVLTLKNYMENTKRDKSSTN